MQHCAALRQCYVHAVLCLSYFLLTAGHCTAADAYVSMLGAHVVCGDTNKVQHEKGSRKQDHGPLGSVVLGSLSSSKKGWVRAPMAVTLVTGL